MELEKFEKLFWVVFNFLLRAFGYIFFGGIYFPNF